MILSIHKKLSMLEPNFEKADGLGMNLQRHTRKMICIVHISGFEIKFGRRVGFPKSDVIK